MTRRCAWCGTVYGHSEPVQVAITSHGMCPPCHHRLVQHFEESQEDARASSVGLPPTIWITRSSSAPGSERN